MKRFTFKLQTVLEKRRAEEEEKQRELGLRLKELEDERKELDRLLSSQAECRQKLMVRVGSEVDPSERRQCFLYLADLHDCIVACRSRISQLEAAVATARANLSEAAKNRSIVEKLKEKQFNDYKKKAAALEQKSLDEIAISRFARKGDQS